MRIRGFDFFGSLSTCFTIYLVKLKQYEGTECKGNRGFCGCRVRFI